MEEERFKKNSKVGSQDFSWVSKSCKLSEGRDANKDKADDLDSTVQGEIEDEVADDLAGVGVLHGLDKVIEGGAVDLTVKDQITLAYSDTSEEVHSKDVLMDEDEAPRASGQEREDEAGGWTEDKDTSNDENPVNEIEENIVPERIIHEVPVGKGLSGGLNLLKEIVTLKRSVDCVGRNMDKKKIKRVGIMGNDVDYDKLKDIGVERIDEFGRIMTPKEAFRMLSNKFHGKGSGKRKQEKQRKQYQEELKLKQMENSDTLTVSKEGMRGIQARL